MGLPVRQRRELERIECTLTGSDPKLAALYGIFAKLNRDEEMPRIEQLRHKALVALARLHVIPAAVGAKLRIKRLLRLQPRQRYALFFPVAVALAVVGIVFLARATSGNSSCTQIRTVSAAQKTHNKSKLCRPPYRYSTMYVGK
jgi:uncharacterized membrane protein